jgi:hypothetical protein
MIGAGNQGRDWLRAYFVAIECSALALAVLFAIDYNTRIATGPFPTQEPALYRCGCPILFCLLAVSTIFAWIWRRSLAIAATITLLVTAVILFIAPNFVRA